MICRIIKREVLIMQRIAENIRTLEVRLSEEIYSALGVLAKQREKFVAEAIKEKREREKRRNLMIEGYQATFQEDLALAREFEAVDFENV